MIFFFEEFIPGFRLSILHEIYYYMENFEILYESSLR